jgi:hypothetical protein
MFRLFPSHNQGACYMVQRKKNVYIFQDTVIYISSSVSIYRRVLNQPSHDTHTTTQSNAKQKTFLIFYL